MKLIANNDTVYVYFHVNKTGGTTFANHLYACFGEDSPIAPMLNPYHEEVAKAENRVYWPDDSLDHKLKARIISGHKANPRNVRELAPYKNIRYIAYFRDPSSRIVSKFNYSKARGMIDPERTFEEQLRLNGFLETQLYFFMYGFLDWTDEEMLPCYEKDQGRELMHIALDHIRDFFFIGLNESYNEDTLLLTNHLNLPPITTSYNITGRDHEQVLTLTDEITDLVREHYPIDFEFYENIKAIRDEWGSPFSTAIHSKKTAEAV